MRKIKKIHLCLQQWLMVMEMPGEPQKLVEVAATIILSSELAVLDGWYGAKGGSIGITDCGQRFDMYLDLLAAASREVEIGSEKSQPDEGFSLAISMIQHHPQIRYFYYAAAAFSQGWNLASPEETIALCEKGLAIDEPLRGEGAYIRLGLLGFASKYNEFWVLGVAQHTSATNIPVTHLKSALEHITEYVRTSPLDTPELPNQIVQLIWLTLLMRPNSAFEGPEDLISWLKKMERQLQQVDKIACHLYFGKTVMHQKRAVVTLILTRILVRNGRYVFNWNGRSPKTYIKDDKKLRTKFSVIEKALDHRSCCGNGSVKLKKCSACEKTLESWKVHKEECKAKKKEAV
ncbi:hypothetical protein HK102_001878 [Quaeritorhiza haematococci]|nr:hypothetical protein HK102_001878 [Quaeritorhiza haematococci]